MIQPNVTIDSRSFDRAFRRYLVASKKTLAEVCNQKAARVAVAAVRETKKANRSNIESELGRYVQTQETNKRGRTVKRRKLVLVSRKGHSAPLAELIINARRGRAGEPGLEGSAMAAAVKKMVASRFRSIGFLASGWLAALKRLLPVLKSKAGLRSDRTVKAYGRDKGTATPAKEGWSPSATIINSINQGPKASDIISRGLQRAFDTEARDMEAYVSKKMDKDAQAFNRS